MAAMSASSGVLLVDKPAGPTSFDVVRRVRSALGVRRAGHTGTLDPAATGLLPVCVGEATRLATFLTEGDKEYEGVVRFGERTDTLDAAGTVVETRDASALTRARVEAAVQGLLGERQQVPPMYSALKVGGRRLYELARQGEEVERAARAIRVDAARLLAWEPPEATLLLRCTKGTYVRSLAETLGEQLGTVAHLKALRRTATGPFRVEQAITLAHLEALVRESGRDAGAALLLTAEQALVDLPAVQLDERLTRGVALGQPLSAAALSALGAPALEPGRHVRLVAPGGEVVAVGEVEVSGDVRLARVLRAQVGPGTSGRSNGEP